MTGLEATASRARIPRATLFGHPIGLSVLFLTDTAGYFSAFGMQALLVLYMTHKLGYAQGRASWIYGLYVGIANLTPLLGGFIADRYLGKTRAVVTGALLMALGHMTMIWEAGLYGGLALVALGNGFFGTSLVSQVGDLYAGDDPRRDRAYVIYYLGINLGSFIAPIVCGWLAQYYGWHFGFGAAAVAMTLGLAAYLGFLPRLRGSLLGGMTTNTAVAARDQTPAGSKYAALALVLGLVILFRLGYEQTGNTIALWIDGSTDRLLGSFQIPAAWFQSLNPLLIFTLTPILTSYWDWRARKGREIPTLRKMTLGCGFAALAYLSLLGGASELHRDGSAGMIWSLGYFLLMTLAEIHVLPIGLSLFGRLSPAAHASLMIGIWYFAKFVASIAAGGLGALWTLTTPAAFFTGNLVVALVTMLLMHGAAHLRLLQSLTR